METVKWKGRKVGEELREETNDGWLLPGGQEGREER